MAHTDVDKVNGWIIRKLHSPDKSKTFGYISILPEEDGTPKTVIAHDTLTDARRTHGFLFAAAQKPSKSGRKH